MGTHFEWRDEFNIGVDVIDREHQRLFIATTVEKKQMLLFNPAA